MDIRKGFFRLTVVLSVLVGVIAVLLAGYRYKIYEVKEEIFYVKPAEAPEPLFYKDDKDEATFLANIYHFDLPGALKEGYSYREIINHLRHKQKRELAEPAFTQTMKFEWDEMSKNPTDSDYKKIFRIEKEEEEWLVKEQVKEKGFNRGDRSARYTVLGVEDAIKWKTLILSWILGFCLVWAVYAFARWVIFAFVVKGFKSESMKGGEPD